MPDSNYYQSRKDSVKIKDEKMSRSNSRTRNTKYQHRRDDSGEGRSGDRKKKDRRKGRSRTRSVSSDSSLDNEAKFDKLLDKKRLQKLEEEKERKRRMKELETPDEKRARRIAKKLQKEERRRTNALSAFPDGIPYTDLNNPFNDNNLTETFVWNKKWETEGKAGISRKKVEKINRDTIAKNFAEMEQLKRNREARDSAREDMEMIARDQERRQCDWNRTEDIFHLNQARLRSSIRIKEGRGKPIDYLARYISYMDENNKDGEEEFQLDNPLSYLPNDSVEDFEDLIADIKIYRVIDGQKNKIYWDDIEIVAKSGLKKLIENRRRSMDSGTVHSSVQEEVNKIFKGKSYDELEQLESQIQAKIKNASKGTDVSYWEALLDQLRPFMAKQRLKELHVKMQQERLRRIRAEQIAEMETLEKKEIEEEEAMEEDEEQKNEEEEEDLPTSSSAIKQKEERKGDKELMETEEVKKFPPKFEYDPNVFVQPEGLPPQSNKTLLVTCADMLKMEDEQREQAYLQLESRGQLEQFSLVCYEQGGYSPSYGSQSHTMPGIEILDEAEDANRMREIRTKNRAQASGGQALNGKDQQMMEIAKKGMTNDEAEFSVEEALEKQHFLWSDKYRPRKPRYFNRVHTGFDWNKYNQTHYDIDNPPPKIVQGYRFNIFYSDLLDPSHTPTFTLTRCEDPDFAIIRFRSGPPYEDIAFKIVNREWEISWKHGYKCQFQNGVFQLWFFFKRYRYRR